MTFIKICKLNISLLAIICCAFNANAAVQTAWDNPNANIVAIDYDPGASEVNQLNRIKLMLSTANKNLKKKQAQS